MIDIHRLVDAWQIEVFFETLPEEMAAVYQPKSENQPAKILLQKQRPFTREEIRELLAMGLVFHQWIESLADNYPNTLFLDCDPYPEHSRIRDHAALMLIDLEELSGLLHAGIDDIVTLSQRFGCRPLLLERRLALEDVQGLWDSDTQTHRQIILRHA